MFWIFLFIAVIGGWIVGRSLSEGDSVGVMIGAVVAMVGIFGNAGVFA